MSIENPTIQRCPHDEENPYLQVSRALIRDNRISLECRGLIIYLLANKDNWKIYVKKLIADFKGQMGKNKIYDLLNEAIDAGYMMREEFLVNCLARVRYFVSESAKFKTSEKSKERKSLSIYPLPENRDPGNQDPENRDAKERIIDKKNQREEPTSISPSGAEEEKLIQEKPIAKKPEVQKQKWGAYVEITEEEFLRLINVYGRNVVLDIFESINDHITNNRNGKGYKDYCAAFRTFYKNQSKRNSSWTTKQKSPIKSNDFKATSLDRDTPELILVPLSSIMNTECALTRGLKEERAC